MIARLAAAALAVLLFGSTAARADPAAEETARVKALFRSGMLHYKLGEYKEAMVEFKEAYQLRTDPVFLFNIGQCSRLLGDTTAAARAYRAYLKDAPDAANRAEVEQLLANIEGTVAAKPTEAKPLTEDPSKATVKPPAKETTSPVTPRSAEAPTPEPIVAPPRPAPSVVPDRPRSRSKSGLYAAIGVVVAVVVVGGGVGVGLGLGLQPAGQTQRSTPPTSDLGTRAIQF